MEIVVFLQQPLSHCLHRLWFLLHAYSSGIFTLTLFVNERQVGSCKYLFMVFGLTQLEVKRELTVSCWEKCFLKVQ